jgi:6-phosphogluconate dehydrogenase
VSVSTSLLPEPCGALARFFYRVQGNLSPPDSGVVRGVRSYKDAKEFVASLAKPRKLMFLVTAGPTVDKVIDTFAPLLEAGDILIDGGNEWFENSERRAAHVTEVNNGVLYVAMGVSGGESGARFGPSIMPGGPPEAWEALKPILTAIAAQVDGEACTCHIGPGSGCGNYVKMVHNGIEYGDMQLIGEAYTVLKMVGGLSNDELSSVFTEWNKNELESYLIEITSHILAKKDVDCVKASDGAKNPDDDSRYMVDMVLDRTGNKGTGKMTIKEGAERGTAVATMSAALDTRFISFDKVRALIVGQAGGRAQPPTPAR